MIATRKAQAWQARHNHALLPAFDSDAAMLGAVRCLVEENEAELWEVREYKDGPMIGAYVLRFWGKRPLLECEIVAAGALPGSPYTAMSDLVGNILPRIQEYAAKRGALGIRLDTYREGLIKKLTGQGWRALSMRLWLKLEKNDGQQ